MDTDDTLHQPPTNQISHRHAMLISGIEALTSLIGK